MTVRTKNSQAKQKLMLRAQILKHSEQIQNARDAKLKAAAILKSLKGK